MNKYLVYVLLVFLAGCARIPMTEADFVAITVGCDMDAIESHYGCPFDTTTLDDGVQECRYITRFDVDSETVDQREYIFKVRNGKVIDKQLRHQQCHYYEVMN